MWCSRNDMIRCIFGSIMTCTLKSFGYYDHPYDVFTYEFCCCYLFVIYPWLVIYFQPVHYCQIFCISILNRKIFLKTGIKEKKKIFSKWLIIIFFFICFKKVFNDPQLLQISLKSFQKKNIKKYMQLWHKISF